MRGQLPSHESLQAPSPPKKELRLKAEPRDTAGVEPTQKNKQARNTTRGRCGHSKKRRAQLPSHESPQASSPHKKQARPTADPRDAAGVEFTQKSGEAKGRAKGRRRCRVHPKNKQVQNPTRGRCGHSKKRRAQSPSHETSFPRSESA